MTTAPKPFLIFTHTPLHVGAGKAVGYVDQPIQREAHTQIPIIPGSSLKGVLRDHFNGDPDVEWLFGKESAEHAGALLIGEARVFAFLVRSAKGCFAWITSPLVLKRAQRDKVFKHNVDLTRLGGNDADKKAITGATVKLPDDKVVLEEYTLDALSDPNLGDLENSMKGLLSSDPVWEQLPGRLVIVSNGLFSYFVLAACEIAQHVRIEDETGTASDGGLFNQENVPAETLFYGLIAAQDINKKKHGKSATDA